MRLLSSLFRAALIDLKKMGRSGAVLPLTALFMALMVFVVAFSIDTSMAYGEQSRMQAAADHAARAAAQMKATMNSTQTLQENMGYSVAAANGYTNGGANSTVVTVNTNPVTEFNYAVEVTITNSKPTIFNSLLGQAALAHKVRALAAWDFSPCIVALDRTNAATKTGITISGGTVFNAGCGMWSNSTSSNSINPNGQVSVFSAGYMIATGGGMPQTTGIYGVCPTGYDCSTSVPTPAPSPNIDLTASFYDNPYSGLTPSTTGVTQRTTTCDSGGTIQPGYYKGTFPLKKSTGTGANKVVQSANCVLAPGTYFVDTLSMSNGDLVQSQTCDSSSTTCGVTIVVVDQPNQNTQSPISIQGGELNISASNTGTYQGVAIFSNLSSTMTFGAQFNTTSTGACAATNTCGINGIVAVPNAFLKLSGGSSTSQNCVSYIGSYVTLSGNVGIGKGCSAQAVNASKLRSSKLVE